MNHLSIKRVYAAPSPQDGTRVLVDRYWPRGLSKEQAALTRWLKEVAPSRELIAWFRHDPARWEEFQQRYRAELHSDPAAQEGIDWLCRQEGPLTLLYGARDERHNNAVALAAYLQQA